MNRSLGAADGVIPRRLVVLALVLATGSVHASVLLSTTAADTLRTPQTGETKPLSNNMALGLHDTLISGARGYADLQLGRHGVLEMGASTRLKVHQLPFASFATDLRTEVRLEKGYLRVVWKHPELTLRWPLIIDVGPYRAHLSSGEYFFEQRDADVTVCVAEGELALAVPGEGLPKPLGAPACFRLSSGTPIVAAPQALAAFVPVRSARALGAVVTAAGFTLTPPIVRGPVPTARPSFNQAMNTVINGGAPPPRPPTMPLPTAAPRLAEAPTSPPPVSPAPAPAPAAAGGPTWALNVASLASRDAALQIQQQLIGKGYEPVIVPTEVQGRLWFRVQFTGLPSAAVAQALAAKLKAETGFSGAWVIPPVN